MLKEFDDKNNNFYNGVLLLQKVPYFDLNCMEMAEMAKCKRFIASATAQNLSNKKTLETSSCYTMKL